MALECLRRTVQGHQRLQILRNCSKNDVTDRKAKEKINNHCGQFY